VFPSLSLFLLPCFFHFLFTGVAGDSVAVLFFSRRRQSSLFPSFRRFPLPVGNLVGEGTPCHFFSGTSQKSGPLFPSFPGKPGTLATRLGKRGGRMPLSPSTFFFFFFFPPLQTPFLAKKREPSSSFLGFLAGLGKAPPPSFSFFPFSLALGERQVAPFLFLFFYRQKGSFAPSPNSILPLKSESAAPAPFFFCLIFGAA